jgi:hypothetical protein
MRVLHNELEFVVGDAEPKIVEAGEYETEDPTEIELLTTLAEADALTILSQ